MGVCENAVELKNSRIAVTSDRKAVSLSIVSLVELKTKINIILSVQQKIIMILIRIPYRVLTEKISFKGLSGHCIVSQKCQTLESLSVFDQSRMLPETFGIAPKRAMQLLLNGGILERV
jgi:hypothetical protein